LFFPQRTLMQRLLLFIAPFPFVLAPDLVKAQVFPSSVDICMQQDVGASVLRVSLRANDQDFGEVLSGLVFTIRWPESSAATLSVGNSAWCPPSQAFTCTPSAQIAPGNGFKYKTWQAIGTGWLSELIDNGGCEQVLLADTWTEVLAIPINNGGGTQFALIDDDYTSLQEVNRNFYVSLNGEWIVNGDTLTGTICSASTDIPLITDDGPFFQLAPNPTSGPIQLTGVSAASAPECEVVDATGRVIISERLNTTGPWMLDLSGHAPGVYQVIVKTTEGLERTSVVLERP